MLMLVHLVVWLLKKEEANNCDGWCWWWWYIQYNINNIIVRYDDSDNWYDEWCKEGEEKTWGGRWIMKEIQQHNRLRDEEHKQLICNGTTTAAVVGSSSSNIALQNHMLRATQQHNNNNKRWWHRQHNWNKYNNNSNGICNDNDDDDYNTIRHKYEHKQQQAQQHTMPVISRVMFVPYHTAICNKKCYTTNDNNDADNDDTMVVSCHTAGWWQTTIAQPCKRCIYFIVMFFLIFTIHCYHHQHCWCWCCYSGGRGSCVGSDRGGRIIHGWLLSFI